MVPVNMIAQMLFGHDLPLRDDYEKETVKKFATTFNMLMLQAAAEGWDEDLGHQQSLSE